MTTPTRPLPFRRGQSYTGANRCPLCSHLEPFHYGFCDGSIGQRSKAISTFLAFDRHGRAANTANPNPVVASEPEKCDGCGYIVCSCPEVEPEADPLPGHCHHGPKRECCPTCSQKLSPIASRPGWKCHVASGTRQWYHPSEEATVWWDPGDPAGPHMCAKPAALGTPYGTLEAAFAAAEKAIEKSGWRGGECWKDIAKQRWAKGSAVVIKQPTGWRYSPPGSVTFASATSMVEAFALVEIKQ